MQAEGPFLLEKDHRLRHENNQDLFWENNVVSIWLSYHFQEKSFGKIVLLVLRLLKNPIPKQGLKCQYCLSAGIEEMRDQISPTQFIPFNLPLQPDRKLRRSRRIRLSSLLNKSTFSADLINSTLSFMRVVEREWYEAQRTSVDDEKYGKLEKVISLPSKCSVCQESSGGGIKLNCKDEFQKECIKSWWQILFLSEWQLNPMPLSSTLASEPTPSPCFFQHWKLLISDIFCFL